MPVRWTCTCGAAAGGCGGAAGVEELERALQSHCRILGALVMRRSEEEVHGEQPGGERHKE